MIIFLFLLILLATLMFGSWLGGRFRDVGAHQDMFIEAYFRGEDICDAAEYGHGWCRMMAYHCDRDGCDTWAKVGGYAASEFVTLKSEPQPLNTLSMGDRRDRHFCTLDCLMQWAAAHSTPTETVQL